MGRSLLMIAAPGPTFMACATKSSAGRQTRKALLCCHGAGWLSVGWLTHWGGLLRERAGRLDVAAGRLAVVAVLSGVQALLNPQSIRKAA
jgi:hypothetical protein